MEKINVKILREGAKLPAYGSLFAAGADLYAAIDDNIVIEPHSTILVPTGIAMEIPEGFGGFIFARSGLASKRGLAPANKVGVIDSDYRGEIMVALHNHGNAPATVEKGERIAQLCIMAAPQFEFVLEESLSDTERGCGGFGSTGKK